MSDNSDKLDRDIGMPGRMEPSSIGLMDSHVPTHSRRLPDKPKPNRSKYGESDRRQRYRLRKDIKPAFSIWCLTSRPSSGLERLYS